MAQASAKALQSSLSKLEISQKSPGSNKPSKPMKITKSTPADSWEDEADTRHGYNSSDTETELTPVRSTEGTPAPPPPTPSSPSMFLHTSTKSAYRTYPSFGLDAASDSNPSSGNSTPSKRGGDGDERRPEKSTAVASRLIAAGIGQSAPKRTKEQREYDQAMKVQEKKKRDQAREDDRERKAASEKAKRDMWGD